MANNRKWTKAKEDWTDYHKRDKILKQMGFASYQDYLASYLWKRIRKKRLSTQKHCSCCPFEAEEIHHDGYYKKLLLGDKKAIQRDLHPLCHSCHVQVEFAGKRKRSSGEAKLQFHRMLRQYEQAMVVEQERLDAKERWLKGFGLDRDTERQQELDRQLDERLRRD